MDGLLAEAHCGMAMLVDLLHHRSTLRLAQAVSSPEEAAALMSRSRYGLTAACYSRDEGVARRLLRAADVGTVFWNGCGCASWVDRVTVIRGLLHGQRLLCLSLGLSCCATCSALDHLLTCHPVSPEAPVPHL